MNTPKRLLDSSQTDALTRKLLGAARPVEPPPGASSKVWLALSSQIPALPPAPPAVPVPPPDPVALATASQQGVWAVFLKPALVGAVLAGSAVGAHSLATAPPAPAPAVAPAALAARAPAASAAAAPLAPVSTASAALTASTSPPVRDSAPLVAATAAVALATAAPQPSAAALAEAPPPALASAEAPALSPSAERIRQLQTEAELLRQARAALASGDPAGALRLLAQGSSGALYQEREVLSIEALAASGQGGAAADRARAFLGAFPGSPHAARVRPYLR